MYLLRCNRLRPGMRWFPKSTSTSLSSSASWKRNDNTAKCPGSCDMIPVDVTFRLVSSFFKTIPSRKICVYSLSFSLEPRRLTSQTKNASEEITFGMYEKMLVMFSLQSAIFYDFSAKLRQGCARLWQRFEKINLVRKQHYKCDSSEESMSLKSFCRASIRSIKLEKASDWP